MSDGAFGKLPLRVIGATGGHGSGKTFSMLSLMGDKASNFDEPPKILVFDDELSCCMFDHIINMEIVNVYEKFADLDGKERFSAVCDFLDKVPKGKYMQCHMDTIEWVEDDVYSYLEAHPDIMGHTAGQYANMSALLHGDVKKFLHRWIMQKILSRFQLFTFAAHEREVWKHNKPTGKKKPYGKKTWMQLAHLYVSLDRSVEPGKAKVDMAPRATVLKDRIMSQDKRPVLPPHIADFSGDKIREYIDAPANWTKLKASEKLPEEVLTQDDRVEREKEIADTKLETERIRQENLILEKTTSVPPSPIEKRLGKDMAEKKAAEKTAKDAPAPDTPREEPKEGKAERITPDQAAGLIVLAKRINGVQDGYWNGFLQAIQKYTVGATDLPGDIQAEFYDRIIGGVKTKCAELEVSDDPN